MAYRSGFHGFCAATADFLNSQVRVAEGEDAPYQPIDIAVEVFNDTDRFSRGGYAKHRAFIVTQSRTNGTPRLFETAWLGDDAPHDERAALTAFARFVADSDPGGNSLVRLMLDGLGDPGTDFWELVMAATLDGLRTQRYPESDLARFSRRMGDLLSTMDFSREEDLFALMFRTAAALFYGPASPYALMGSVEVTQQAPGRPSPSRPSRARLLLMQVFDDSGAWVGVHGTASQNDVVFLGREDDPAAYEGRCDGDLAQLLAGRNRQILALPLSNKWVSRVHGVVYFEGESWHFEDMGSTYGSQVRRADGRPVGGAGASELRPGDRLCLGVEGVQDPYGSGATLAVSMLVDAFAPVSEDDASAAAVG